MKQQFMKKVLAVTLSAAMACSVSAASNLTSASAAPKKFVGLNTTFKTLRVGQKDYKLRLVNNTSGWKVKKATSSDKTIAAVYGKTASYVKLKGKSEGRATIKLQLKTDQKKKKNTKNLRCRVNVIQPDIPDMPATPDTPDTPNTPDTPSVTESTVRTQAELNAALANQNLKTLNIRTDANEKFIIAKGSYPSVSVHIEAPNAEVENNALFASITINAIKESSWHEFAEGNRIKFNAKKGRLIAETGSKIAEIIFQSANAAGSSESACLEVKENANISKVVLSAKTVLEILGDAKQTGTLQITLEKNAKDSVVKTSIKISLTAQTSAEITLQKGAENSEINAAGTEKEPLTVKNETDKSISVKKANGSTETITSGNKRVVTNPAASTNTNPNNNWYPTTGGGSSNNTSTPPSTPSKPSTPTPVEVSGITVEPATLALNLTDNKSQQLKATIAPSNAANKEVEWTSSAPEIATVEPGADGTATVTAVAAGEATITATAKGTDKTATCAVTVTAPAPIDISASENAEKLVVTGLDDAVAYKKDQEAKPEVTVTYDGQPLTAGTDYELTYSDNTGIGTGTVTITGKGSYAGSVDKTFTIQYTAASMTVQAVNADLITDENTDAGVVTGIKNNLSKITMAEPEVNGNEINITFSGHLSELTAYNSSDPNQSSDKSKWIAVGLETNIQEVWTVKYGNTEDMNNTLEGPKSNWSESETEIIWHLRAEKVADPAANALYRTHYFKVGENGETITVNVSFIDTDVTVAAVQDGIISEDKTGHKLMNGDTEGENTAPNINQNKITAIKNTKGNIYNIEANVDAMQTFKSTKQDSSPGTEAGKWFAVKVTVKAATADTIEFSNKANNGFQTITAEAADSEDRPTGLQTGTPDGFQSFILWLRTEDLETARNCTVKVTPSGSSDARTHAFQLQLSGTEAASTTP